MLLLTTSFLGYPLPRSHRHGGFEKKVSIHKLFLSFPNKGGCSGESAGKQGNRSSVIPTKSIQSQNTKSFTSASFNASLWVVHWAINTSSILSPDKSETLQMIMPHTWIACWKYPKIKSRFSNMGSHPTKSPGNNNTNETVLGICVFNRSCCSFLLLLVLLSWGGCAAVMRALTSGGLPTVRGPWCMVASSKGSDAGRVLVLAPCPSCKCLGAVDCDSFHLHHQQQQQKH